MALVPFPDRHADLEPAGQPDDLEPAEDRDLEPSAGKMSFLEHLDELRQRLLVAIGAVVVGFLAAFVFIDHIFAFIMRPLQQVLPNGGTLIYTEPTEAFMLHLKIAALAGLMLAAPVIMWQVWLFIAPGLYANEKKFAIPFIGFSTAFFAAGALFSHYMVFPWAWRFLAGFSNDYMTFTPRIAPVFSLYSKMLLSFGAIFQMPTLVFFLARMGLVTARFLVRKIKYAILIIFVTAAVLTPTGDVVTQALMAVPMVVLYVISIGIAWLFAKPRRQA